MDPSAADFIPAHYRVSQPRLSVSGVHIWRSNLDLPSSEIQLLQNILSDDERNRANQYHFDAGRQRFIVARGLLRTLLGHYLGKEPASLCFQYGVHGKPSLKLERGEADLRFNLSHSNDHAVFAITLGREVGVDIEYARPLADMAGIAHRFFSRQEYCEFRNVSRNEKLSAFYNCWTRKEAFVKASGNGLSQPLDTFSVSLIPGQPARVVSIEEEQCPPDAWTLIDLVTPPGYIAAFACQGQNIQIDQMQTIDH